jgi:GntR family transcriptional regulator of arabinose operon
MSEDIKPIKYQILADAIMEKIKNGYYQPGDKLSSENELSRQLGYSRQTVRQALSVLERNGILSRQRGSGTYINSHVPKPERTHRIGVITTYITDYIFPSITRGIEDELSKNGYQLTLGVTKNRVENEAKILKSFLESNIDGMIVEGTKTAFPNPNIPLYLQLQNEGIPCVFINGYYRDLPSIYVATNDRDCGYEAAEYLLHGNSEKKLGGIFKSDDMQGHERYAGFAGAIFEHGSDLNDESIIWYTTADKDEIFSQANAAHLLKCLNGCSGVVCYNDQIAYELIEFLLAHSIRVPEDIEVIGFDNSNLSEYSKVKITTFDHPKELLGQQAADKIIHMVENGAEEKSVVMNMNFVIKNSTK